MSKPCLCVSGALHRGGWREGRSGLCNPSERIFSSVNTDCGRDTGFFFLSYHCNVLLELMLLSLFLDSSFQHGPQIKLTS